MTEQVGLSVIVPAYNEAAAIGRTLEAMRAFLEAQPGTYEIIVAVDGNDDTAGIVAAAAKGWPNLFCTVEPGRHGKGHGIRRAAKLARGSVIGFIDADYKTPIEEATKLLPLLNDGYDLVIGSRAVEGARVEIKQPRYRQSG